LGDILPKTKVGHWGFQWRSVGISHEGFAVHPGIFYLRAVRTCLLWAEVAFFAFIPSFAAAMARGYGIFAH
jgi:uncharacterized membrane protein